MILKKTDAKNEGSDGRASHDACVCAAGLGLATVEQTVEQHYGTSTVGSVTGKGTRFHFKLPFAQKQ